jgi:hypothetical protein
VINRPRVFVVLLALSVVLMATGLRADEAVGFAKRIKDVVNPRFEGEQFAEGSIPRTMEDRYDSAFEPAPFDSMFGSDDVGGILLRAHPRRPVKVLRLDSATFRIENAEVDSVVFRLAADSKRLKFRVPATIVPAAALMAADRRLVLLTLSCGSARGDARSHADLAAAHPAIARHQMAFMAAQLDLSLLNVAGAHGRNYLLCENPWRLSLKSFSTRDSLFAVRCRVDAAETTPEGITAAWQERLDKNRRRWFGVLNDFAAVHRLVRAVLDGYVVGFPQSDFIKLLEQLQPIYEKHKMTQDQVDELRALLATF